MRLAANQELILGPPGTGKTTSLMTMLEEDLKVLRPEQVALVSFTRKAVNEATDRVCAKFKLERKRFVNFQTVHAMCYRALGCSRKDLMSTADYKELGAIFGLPLLVRVDIEDGALSLPDRDKGAKMLFIDSLARAMRKPLKEVWKNANINIMWPEIERFSMEYAKFKAQNFKMDFTDLLEKYIREGDPLNIKVAYVDEAQDLSRIQWEVLRKCFANAERVTVAGDDDQSIFKWSGADLDTFLSLEGTKRVLAHSYRLPRAVYGKAAAIIKRVKRRFDKQFEPTELPGKVQYVSTLDHIRIDPDEKTLVLVRNTYLMHDVYELLKTRGLNFSGRNGFQSINEEHVRSIIAWERLRKGEAITLEQVKDIYEHLRVGEMLARGGKAELLKLATHEENFTWETLRDHYGLLQIPIWHKALIGIPTEKREYYIGQLKRGKRLTAEANVHVNTIHGVKGGEADHVVILSDVSRRTYEEMQKDPCSEHRTFYVAVTRSKKTLTIVLQQGKYGYQI